MAHILQSDIDSLPVSDINWTEKPPVRLPSIPSNNPPPQDNLSDRINLSPKLNVTLLFDRSNNIVYQNISEGPTNRLTSPPKGLLASLRPGSPLLDATDNQAIIKGILVLPEGLLMIISAPVFQDGRDVASGRLIGGRFIDDTEIERLSESTKLDIKVVAYNNGNMSDDFIRAKGKLDAVNRYYVEPVNNQLVSSYTMVDDIYGRPAIMLRALMPRFISQYGQDSINSFFASLLIIIVLLAAVAFLLLERTILSRLSILNAGLASAQSTNNLTLEVLPTGSDEIAALTNSVKDIFKAHIQTKSQLQETRETLEKRVVERTIELTNVNANLEQELGERRQTNQSLTQARDKALAELQLKSQLLANVSHDSRTPLTIITLNTEMLQQGRHGELNVKQSEVLDRILSATRQLMNFITNMLDEAQLKHGKMPFVNVTFEPRLLIEEFVTMLEPLATHKGIELKAELDLALPSQIKGDPERLKQILSNLAENAIKFTDHGTVTIKAERTDGRHWTIKVIDTGRGIPAEAQSRIFEAYWQLNSTLKRDASRGIGLGLSIVKQIVQLMKGSISVASKVGEGTTFTITLPIEEITTTEPELHLII